jgi:hypothetical protein
MTVNQDLLAPCGLYCGVCGVFVASRDNNQKFKEKLSGVYGVTPEEVHCLGCKSDTIWKFCRMCHIRDCTESKGYVGCHECDDWPCQHIEQFPIAVGKQVIMRAIPQWREWGTEKWVEAETERYLCPECGNALFRGVKKCRQCQTPVDLD